MWEAGERFFAGCSPPSIPLEEKNKKAISRRGGGEGGVVVVLKAPLMQWKEGETDFFRYFDDSQQICFGMVRVVNISLVCFPVSSLATLQHSSTTHFILALLVFLRLVWTRGGFEPAADGTALKDSGGRAWGGRRGRMRGIYGYAGRDNDGSCINEIFIRRFDLEMLATCLFANHAAPPSLFLIFPRPYFFVFCFLFLLELMYPANLIHRTATFKVDISIEGSVVPPMISVWPPHWIRMFFLKSLVVAMTV